MTMFLKTDMKYMNIIFQKYWSLFLVHLFFITFLSKPILILFWYNLGTFWKTYYEQKLRIYLFLKGFLSTHYPNNYMVTVNWWPALYLHISWFRLYCDLYCDLCCDCCPVGFWDLFNQWSLILNTKLFVPFGWTRLLLFSRMQWLYFSYWRKGYSKFLLITCCIPLIYPLAGWEYWRTYHRREGRRLFLGWTGTLHL